MSVKRERRILGLSIEALPLSGVFGEETPAVRDKLYQECSVGAGTVTNCLVYSWPVNSMLGISPYACRQVALPAPHFGGTLLSPRGQTRGAQYVFVADVHNKDHFNRKSNEIIRHPNVISNVN